MTYTSQTVLLQNQPLMIQLINRVCKPILILLGAGFLFFCAELGCAYANFANAESEEDTGYFAAATLFNQKRWPEAQIAFQAFAKKYPASRWRSAVKLRLADLESDPQTALASYSDVLHNSTDQEWKLLARWGMAQTYYTLGQYRESLEQYRQTNQIRGMNQAKALTMSGLCLMALKQPKEARICFEQAAAMTDLPSTAWSEQALACMGDADMAANDFSAAAKSYALYLQKYPQGDYAERVVAGKTWAMKALEKTVTAKSGSGIAESPKPEAKPTAKPSATPESVPKPTTEPKIESAPEPEHSNTSEKKPYTLQVGAFSNREYAKSLENKLRRKGYKPTIQDYSSANGLLHTVRIGAYASKNEAAKAGNLLKNKEKLPYLILTIKPAASKNPSTERKSGRNGK